MLDPKANAKAAVRIVMVLGGIVLVLLVALWTVRALSSGTGPVAGAAAVVLRGGPEIVADEEFTVDAGGSQMRGFGLPGPRPVKVEVLGRRDTDKGFSVYMIDQSEWDAFKAGRKFEQYPTFEGLKVRSMTKTASMPAGRYAVVVRNSENMFNSMSVHLKITVDP